MTHYVTGTSGESFTDRTVHRSRDCAALSEPSRPLAESSTGALDRCPECFETAETTNAGTPADETCTVVKGDGEVCGRDRPCSYHD